MLELHALWNDRGKFAARQKSWPVGSEALFEVEEDDHLGAHADWRKHAGDGRLVTGLQDDLRRLKAGHAGADDDAVAFDLSPTEQHVLGSHDFAPVDSGNRRHERPRAAGDEHSGIGP